MKRAFLQLVFGSLKPDRGRVVAERVRLSPVVNLGDGGGLLLPSLTVRENIHFQARLAQVGAKLMTDFVVSVCDHYAEQLNATGDEVKAPVGAAMLEAPLNKLSFALRRVAEAAIFAAIPYDCYLVDCFDLLPAFAQRQLFDIARRRGAGLIFAADRPAVAKQFRDSTISIYNGLLSVDAAA